MTRSTATLRRRCFLKYSQGALGRTEQLLLYRRRLRQLPGITWTALPHSNANTPHLACSFHAESAVHAANNQEIGTAIAERWRRRHLCLKAKQWEVQDPGVRFLRESHVIATGSVTAKLHKIASDSSQATSALLWRIDCE